ncbi:MAG: hypothetical protein ACD_54C00728G0001 [uncultured bacterium]|nr:MAG: hypothetical protein ACD_54C00728G0001 [uncultured bacterium]
MRWPNNSNRVMRLRSSGGRVSLVSASAAPAAKRNAPRASSRSMPDGSGPRAITSTSVASPAKRAAFKAIAPSSNPAGRSA